MYVLGVRGGLNSPEKILLDGVGPDVYHDASAVLLYSGKIIAAFEEERLDRIKHSNHFPAKAIHACLSYADIQMADRKSVV